MASTAPVDPVQREPRSRWRPGYWLRHPASAYEKGGWLILGGRLFLTIGLLATAIYLAYLRWTWHRWRNQAERWRHRRPVPRIGKRQDPWRTERRGDSLP